jgi:hypothetical protein
MALSIRTRITRTLITATIIDSSSGERGMGKQASLPLKAAVVADLDRPAKRILRYRWGIDAPRFRMSMLPVSQLKDLPTLGR